MPAQVGPYRIEREIGQGGMGVVLLARDEALDRPAALKTLPTELATDPGRLARFQAEAKLLASLSHGNIASVYGLERADGLAFIAMEFVEGESLQDRLARGPIEFDDALDTARQVAEAIEAAHANGVIHRDLKPGNIVMRPDGQIKVLDFGLAKAVERTGAGSVEPDALPTGETEETSTLPGTIIGTPGYMSPEQAKGAPVDARTDIWAFGCLLYELLTGTAPFDAESPTERLAATLHREPDWSILPDRLPDSLRRVLRRLLSRDPRHRLQAIGDARIELEESARADETEPRSSTPTNRSGPRQLALPTIALILLGVTLVLVWREKMAPQLVPLAPLTRAELVLPEGSWIGWEGAETSLSKIGFSRLIAMSPQGDRVVCTGQDEDLTQLYLKDADGFRLQPIRGTEFARAPFFSPDGNWIGFIAGAVVQKVRLPGGPAEPICPLMSAAFDATWTQSDQIIFSTDNGLGMVSAQGGEPERLTTPDPERDETGHHFPHILPDQRTVLFTVSTTAGMHAALLSLEDGRWNIILRNAADARYVSSGHLVFAREDVVLAAPFDPARPEEVGEPFPLTDTIHTSSGVGGVLVSHFATSRDDALAYVLDQGPPDGDTLMWVDREGRETPITTAPGALRHPRLSPSGDRILFDIQTLDGMRDLYIYEIARGQTRRLTTDGQSFNADWSSDGRFVLYCTGDTTGKSICTIPTDFSSGPVTRLDGKASRYPHLSDVSPDGSTIVYWDRILGGTWLLDSEGLNEPREWLNSNLDERWAELSPDGSLIAYVGTQSGRSEVFVQSFPIPGPRVQVSIQGGGEPLWSRDGSNLYFRFRDAVFSAPMIREPAIGAGSPRLLFTGAYDAAPIGHAHYEVSMDDQLFLMVKHGDVQRPEHIRVISNGIANLGREDAGR